MAIVKMNKFLAIGIDDNADDLMAGLMDFGATELSSQASKLQDKEWAPFALSKKRDLEILEIEGRLNTLESVLKALGEYDTSKKPIFSARRLMTKNEFSRIEQDKSAIEADVNIILDLLNQLKELQNSRNKTETSIISLTPWVEYQIPLELNETKRTYITTCTAPVNADINHIKNEAGEAGGRFIISLISEDQEQQYISIIYMKEMEEEISGILKKYGISKLSFKGLTGSAASNISSRRSGIAEITNKIEELERGLSDMAGRKEPIELLYDYLIITKDKTKALNNILATERAFYIDGWVPAEKSEKLSALLEQYGCHYEIIPPEKDEETPVLLKNNKFIEPIESITALYDIPNSKEVDPTPVYAFFYLCFFGIMLADIAYGLILATLSFALVSSGKLEGNTYKFIKQLGYCGVSACIWGVIFGGFFGDLITVVSATFFGKEASLQPLWMDPVENAMLMLVFACLFGVIHIFVALGVKAYGHIREGRVAAAVNDAFLWYVLITGLGLLLAGETLFTGAAEIGKWMSIVGAAGILLLPVFIAKGAGKLMGLWNLYGIVGYLSDVLSYARLLALCLAGSVIAQVFNLLASLFGSGVIGVIMFIFVASAAHVFNFLMSGLGAFVHSIRLQYVEFFGKFYEGRGIAFQPFMKNTKYVKIIKEEN